MICRGDGAQAAARGAGLPRRAGVEGGARGVGAGGVLGRRSGASRFNLSHNTGSSSALIKSLSSTRRGLEKCGYVPEHPSVMSPG